jgi:hypothetical protein
MRLEIRFGGRIRPSMINSSQSIVSSASSRTVPILDMNSHEIALDTLPCSSLQLM